MKSVLQRVTQARVLVQEQTIGEIGKGYLVLLGIEQEDTEEIAEKMADKIQKLRLFEDDQGKTNLNAEIGAVLDRPANFINRFKVNAFSVLTGKNLSAELEKDPLIYILHF